MDSEFIRGIGRKLMLAIVVSGALMAFATAGQASHCYRGGYGGIAYRSSGYVSAGIHYRGGYGGYGGYRGYHQYGAPVRYYHAPRSYFSFGLSFGYPPAYYAPPPAYVYSPPPVYVAPHPVYGGPTYDDRTYDREEHRDSGRNDRDYDREDKSSPQSGEIDVENEPPAGTYYHDRFCNKDFGTLDDYTEHLKSKHHSQTIDIIDRDSGKRVRTLEFVDGYWQAQK